MKRYRMKFDGYQSGEYEDSQGEWVRWSDVEKLIYQVDMLNRMASLMEDDVRTAKFRLELAMRTSMSFKATSEKSDCVCAETSTRNCSVHQNGGGDD